MILLFTQDAELRRDRLLEAARALGAPEIAVPRRIVHLPDLPLLGNGKKDYVALDRMAASIAVTSSEARVNARRREQTGWYFYDWANSAFSTTVVTLFLGPYLTVLAKAAADTEGYVHPLGIPVDARAWWGYLVSLSVATQVVVPAGAGCHGRLQPAQEDAAGGVRVRRRRSPPSPCTGCAARPTWRAACSSWPPT